MGNILERPGRWLAQYLSRPDPRYAPLATSSAESLVAALQPCDVLLVEGNTRISHHSLFVPRDFDISPYFRIVKPTLEKCFDYHALAWSEAAEEIA